MDTDCQGILKAEQLKPGDLVFSDQYQSSLPGQVFGHHGAWMSSQKYCGGTLFYDAASQHIKVIHQVSLNQHESVQAKLLFKHEALQASIWVSNYQTDNGINTALKVLKEILAQNQGPEAAIKHVNYTANTMMIHAAI